MSSDKLKADDVLLETGYEESQAQVGRKKCCTRDAQDKWKGGFSKVTGTWTEFKLFITKGNVFQMAIGFILALQFNEVVKSLTNDIIMPPIGMAIGNNLISLFVVIKLGKSYYNQSNIVNGQPQLKDPPPPPYLSVVQAQADGAVTWNYGNFFQVCINFIIVALILFMLVTIYAKLTALKKLVLREPAVFVPTMVDCVNCYSLVDERSKLCKFCHRERAPKV